jgi:hypothetical protein
MRQPRSWWYGFLLIFLAFQGGCDFQGLHKARDDGPSTAQFRYEAEFIPNATLVREDTTPHWQLGRYAFKRGADRLLVISRITSVSDKKGKKPVKIGGVISRHDRMIERVWILLPMGTQVGQELKLGQLEQKFQVGYDAGQLEQGIYVQPNRVLGTVTILEETTGTIGVAIDMLVAPQKMPSWPYKRSITLSATPNGVRAKPVAGAITRSSRGQHRGHEVAAGSNTSADAGDQAPALVTKETSPDSGVTVGDGPAETQPSPDAAAEDSSEAQTDIKDLIVGQWIGDSGGGGGFEFRFQFGSDGKAGYSTCRSGYRPMIRLGTYKTENNHVVMNVTFYSEGELVKNRHKDKIKPIEILRCQPDSNGGILLQMIYPEGHTIRYTLKKAYLTRTQFSDLFTNVQPTREAVAPVKK